MAIEDTFIPAYFRVTISASGLGGSFPADGFIDNTTPEQYGATTGLPGTDVLALAKERGNIRFLKLIEQVSTQIAPVFVLDIDAVGADGDTEATSFEFTLVYDKPDFVFTRITTEDGSGTPGDLLEGEAAVERFVARAMTIDFDGNRNIFNPNRAGTPSDTPDDPSKIENVVADKIAADVATAEVNIIVEQIPNT